LKRVFGSGKSDVRVCSKNERLLNGAAMKVTLEMLGIIASYLQPDPFGSTQNARTAPLKSETPHENGRQLL